MTELIAPAALLIEAVGSLYVLVYVLAALWALRQGSRHLTEARLLIADGVLAALNFKVAATLLKTLELQSWQQIAVFAAIFALRTVLKRFFTWERRQLESRLAYRQQV
ncbi:DUF1622 domain-containing protein [Deinococcus sp.]|uniref:DUF1622 domain-containing protein n=1 Tax=Deinococcus sp. TaxID=47478 RepID=UPI003B5CCBE5